jgi:hypothetical protein
VDVHEHHAWHLATGGDFGFNPAALSAVTGWLRLAARTDSGTLTIPDVLGGPSATQATAGNKPTFGTSNGLPTAIVDGADDYLVWPAGAANNATARWGFAGWLNPTTEVSLRRGIVTGHDADLTSSLNFKLWLYRDATSLVLDIQTSGGGLTRRCTVTSFFALDTWIFPTVEFDGGQSTEATRVVITKNGTPQTVTFSSGTAVPAALESATQFALLARRAGAGSESWLGRSGANLFALGGAGGLSGGGLLTAAERAALMAFEAPTT